MKNRFWILLICLPGSFAGGLVANLGCAAVSQAVVLEPAPAREVMRAERFELIDSSGAVRAALTLNRDGVPVLDFVEKGGARHAGLTVGSEGRPLLFLTDAEGRPIWKSP